MTSFWYKPELSEEIIKGNEIYNYIDSINGEILSGLIDIAKLVENMGYVLTNKEPENREKGMRFFTRILTDLPKDFLTDTEVKFISKFYIDRLKDNHRVLPSVLEGYLSIIDMEKYNVKDSSEFFTVLFREVSCQSQVRQDRYNIYLIIKKLLDNDIEYMKTLGPDFTYGVISSMDGERDPRNLLFLFAILPNFIKNIPLGHLTEEMFEVISCYYPIDFYPSSDDPAPVTRQDLANELSPCLCAIPDFGEQCLVLLVEKLDSSLRLAKIDSLKLLAESCKTFKVDSYSPFLKTLWSSIHRELSHKTDNELKLAAHEALSALVAKLAISANTDQSFENFLKGILISMQTVLAESTTVMQFIHATKVLLTTANASKESCVIIVKNMIQAILAYYSFKTSTKLQIASLQFLGDLYDLAKHWEVLDQIHSQFSEIPQLCLTAVSEPIKDLQIAGLKTLIRVINVLETDFVLPFVEVLIHNVQHSQDDELLSVSVETVHAIARKYPELIMSLVVKGKCDLINLTKDRTDLKKRLSLLSNLASIDDFTKVIIEEMLKIITENDEDAGNVVEALSESISNVSLYNNEKVIQIESDHGLIDSILTWIYKENETNPLNLSHGLTLIANTIASLPDSKQLLILEKHTENLLERCEKNELNFFILENLYNSLNQTVHGVTFEGIMKLSLKLALYSEHEVLRTRACVLIGHFLNKVEYEKILNECWQRYAGLYDIVTKYLSSCDREDQKLCPRLILLYGWITKALVMRDNDMFISWLEKIVNSLTCSHFCKYGSEAIRLIMSEYKDCFTKKQHCRIGILYKQRIFQAFIQLMDQLKVPDDAKESYLLSWAYVLDKVPKNVLSYRINRVVPIVIDSLDYDNKDLLLVVIDVLCYLIQEKKNTIANSLQTVLPRLVKLSGYIESMDVRIKSLQCLYEIANTYSTALLLPHKQDVLIDLAPSLDDKKRLVRNAAVRARTRWFLAGAPGEAKPN